MRAIKRSRCGYRPSHAERQRSIRFSSAVVQFDNTHS